mgnify:CR=1 FL=1
MSLAASRRGGAAAARQAWRAVCIMVTVCLSWRKTAWAALRSVRDDRCFALAGQLAFYFLLALFPALLFLVALIGYLPVEDALSELLSDLGTVAPAALVRVLPAQLGQIAGGKQAGLLTLGILGALWSSSAAMAALIDALNRAYGVSEWRVWWKRRILAIGLTLALALLITVALALMLVGPEMASRLAYLVHLETVGAVAWALLRWPVALFCVVFGVDLVYHFAPNRDVSWTWVTPGSIVATLLWIASSFGFRWYVSRFGHYTATYGAIGGAIVIMLWFYVSGIALLIGAELNGVIEHEPRSATPTEDPGPTPETTTRW